MRATSKGHVNTCPTCGGLLLFPSPQNITVKEQADKWIKLLEHQGRSKSYLRIVRSYMTHHIEPFFRAMDITACKVLHVNEFYLALISKQLAPKSIANILACFHVFLVYLHDLDLIERLPRFPRISFTTTREKGWIDAELQERVLLRMSREHRLIFSVFFETGARPSEVCALRKRDIEGAGLWIVRAFDEQGFVKGTKTGKELFRPITEELHALLIEHVRFAFPEAYIFQHAGKLYTRRYLHDLWERAAGVEGVRITLYQAGRHSKVSQLRKELERDMHNRLRDELGHTSSATTMKHYALPGTKEIKR